MAKHNKAYFGLGWVVSLILALIPFTSVLCGIITRVQRGQILGAILNFVVCPVFYIIDIVTMIINKDITVLA